MFTPEDEIDELHRELGRARRLLYDAERAPFDGRMCDPIRWEDALAADRARVRFLERELAEALAAQQAAGEALDRAEAERMAEEILEEDAA